MLSFGSEAMIIGCACDFSTTYGFFLLELSYVLLRKRTITAHYLEEFAVENEGVSNWKEFREHNEEVSREHQEHQETSRALLLSNTQWREFLGLVLEHEMTECTSLGRDFPKLSTYFRHCVKRVRS